MRFINLTKRNIKVYFSDKSMFLTSLITPLILLVLYSTFLGNIFKESFIGVVPEGIKISDKIINGLAAGQILASLLAVSCVTVSFTSNLLMVQDKVNNVRKDFNVTPINKYIISLSYFAASFISTIIVNLVALILCLIYTKTQGWFYTGTDCILLVLDVILLTLFGVSISSTINFLLNSQGQVSAVGSIVSAGYGFICGAYMPIASFSKTLQRTLSFLPGTYGTSLIKNHALQPGLNKFENAGIPVDAVNGLKDGLDCNISFFDKTVNIPYMYAILISTIIIFIIIFVLENILKKEN